VKKPTLKPSCVLLLGDNKRLNKQAIRLVRRYLRVKKVVYFYKQGITEARVAALKPDYVLNFLSDKVLKGALLKFKNVNFHPAPPEWPGRGSASMALFNADKTYGATAHVMEPNVDSGAILLVKRFPISADQLCEDVFRQGKEACLVLLERVLRHIRKYGSLPPQIPEKWRGKPCNKRDFQKWLILNPGNKREFISKIKASKHSIFPGPYLIVHGYKFGLLKGQ